MIYSHLVLASGTVLRACEFLKFCQVNNRWSLISIHLVPIHGSLDYPSAPQSLGGAMLHASHLRFEFTPDSPFSVHCCNAYSLM